MRFDDRDGRGTWICSQGNGEIVAGDGFELLRHCYGWTFPQTVEQVARVLNLSPNTPTPFITSDALSLRWHERGNRQTGCLDLEKQQRHRRCASSAARTWRHAKLATTHPYLRSKRIRPYGIRQQGGVLLVPMRDINGDLWNLQRIDGAGRKRFLRGLKKGLFHLLSTPQDMLLMAEGYATAATAQEATGWPAACAFDAGNLQPAAEAIADHYPRARIVIAADHDAAGLRGARAAAKAVGGWLIAPAKQGIDWNDAGPDAVRAAMAELAQREAEA